MFRRFTLLVLLSLTLVVALPYLGTTSSAEAFQVCQRSLCTSDWDCQCSGSLYPGVCVQNECRYDGTPPGDVSDCPVVSCQGDAFSNDCPSCPYAVIVSCESSVCVYYG